MGKRLEINYRGRIGNLICYKRDGKYLLRLRPEKVNQTDATRASAQIFGKASRICGSMRKSFAPIIPDVKARKLMLSLNKAIYTWLLKTTASGNQPFHQVTTLNHISFNSEVEFSNKIKCRFETNWQTPGELKLYIPAIRPSEELKMPPDTKSALLELMLFSCSLNAVPVVQIDKRTIFLDGSLDLIPSQEVLFNAGEEPGSIKIIAGALKYNNPDYDWNAVQPALKWKPAGIIEAVYIP